MERRLNINDPRVVTRYLTYLHFSMQDYNFFYRMDVLHKTAVYPLHQHLIDEYEDIDVLPCKLMDETEENIENYILNQLHGLQHIKRLSTA